MSAKFFSSCSSGSLGTELLDKGYLDRAVARLILEGVWKFRESSIECEPTMDHSNSVAATGASAEESSGPKRSAPKQAREIPLWRVALFYFLTLSSVALAIHSLARLRALGQPLSGMIVDDLSIAALVALAMTIREWVR